MSYNPIPPRVWSRVQDRCIPDINAETISNLKYDKQMLAKGNVLQYKKNSSNLTKQQRYSQIAKGQWSGRRKCFAAQSETYTNPNTSSFQRINSVNIPFPNTIVGAPNNISGPFQYDVPNPFGCPTTVLVDGGTLVGNTYVNPCSGAVVRKTQTQNCNLTTDSNVPGPIQALCWDPRLATWYPKQRLTMPTSGDKWPEGYKGLVSAITPIPPVLSYNACPLTLIWTYNDCLPISSFYIYEGDLLYAVVPYTTTSLALNGLVSSQTYTFKMKSVSSGIESDFSNSVTFTTPIVEVPILDPIVQSCYVTLNWNVSNNPCPTIQSFNIYQDQISSPIQTILYPTTMASIYGLTPNVQYSFNVTSVSYGQESAHSNTQTVTQLPLYEISGSGGSVDVGGFHVITFTGTGTFKLNCSVSNSAILCVGGGGGGGAGNASLITAEGGGGGSGAVIDMSNCTIPVATYNILVGIGGTGGTGGVFGIDGATTSFGTSLYSGGGKGGQSATLSSPTATGGVIGDCSLNTTFSSSQIYTSLPGIYSDASYNGQGGNGNVNGYLAGSNGNNTFVTLYSAPVSYIQSNYGGGGGGGGINGLGGSGGNTGVGGTLGGSANNNGISASTQGSGGGGGGFPIDSVGGNGGNGGNGVIILKIPIVG